MLQRIPLSAGQPYEVSDVLDEEPQWRAQSSEERFPGSRSADELVKWAITAAGESYLRDIVPWPELHRYWRYSRACAAASDELARQGDVNRALAYSAGLLHDIGRLALVAAYPAQYRNLLALTERMLAAGEMFEMLDYERTLFGSDRFTVASWLADEWGLPRCLRTTVGKFAPVNAHVLDLTTTVRLGCQLACSLGFGLMPTTSHLEPKDVLRKLPGVPRERRTDFNGLSEIIQSQLQ